MKYMDEVAGVRKTADKATDVAEKSIRTGSKNIEFMNPNKIEWTQMDHSEFFDSKAPWKTIDELSEGLRSGKIKPTSVEAIRVYKDGNVVKTLDHRRLEAFKRANMDVPVRWVDLTDPKIADEIYGKTHGLYKKNKH